MANKLNDKQLKELTHINDWCLTILNFMIAKYEEGLGPKMFIEVINDAYQKQNLKGLRCIYNDTNEWAKGLPQTDLDELNKLLKNRFGVDLLKQIHRDLDKITEIIKKGNISNEDEYRLLLSRVDEIYDDKRKKNEVETLNKLLADYYK